MDTPSYALDGSGCLLSQWAEDTPDATLVRQQAARAEQAEMSGKFGLLYKKASSALF